MVCAQNFLDLLFPPSLAFIHFAACEFPGTGSRLPHFLSLSQISLFHTFIVSCIYLFGVTTVFCKLHNSCAWGFLNTCPGVVLFFVFFSLPVSKILQLIFFNQFENKLQFLVQNKKLLSYAQFHNCQELFCKTKK